MEIFEKVFQKFLDKRRNKPTHPSAITLKKYQKTFTIFASGILKTAKEPQLLASASFVGFQGPILYLPTQIQISKSQKINYNIFLHLILQACAARNLEMKTLPKKLSALEMRLLSLEKIPELNTYLDKQYSEFSFFQNQLFQQLASEFVVKGEFQDLFADWKQEALSRATATNTSWIEKYHYFKKNQAVPDFLYYTVPCLEGNILQIAGTAKDQIKKKSEADNAKTEIEKPASSPPEIVDLEKEKVNPVTHSFEKMNTADEYEGGRRIDSGDDELKEHARALEELNLSQVTRDGESVQSIYRSEEFNLFWSSEESLKHKGDRGLLYPEWSVLKSSYLTDHCKLFESTFLSDSNSMEYIQKVIKKHQHSAAIWKKKIQSLLNEPLWINRLLEGDEVDLDSYVREYILLLNKLNVSGRWYAHKRKRVQNVSVFVLFDQSTSADSWVKNQRVLDVITESICMIGWLVGDYISDIQVAGTWSATRQSCHFQYYKRSNEPWSKFWSVAEKIEAQGYTRLGPALRHGATELQKGQGSRKLLLLLTDGRPTDLDGYEGVYGIQDVKKACLEAQSMGILPYAITIEKESKQHFSKMFKHYKVLNSPERMPEELFKILTKLVVGKSL